MKRQDPTRTAIVTGLIVVAAAAGLMLLLRKPAPVEAPPPTTVEEPTPVVSETAEPVAVDLYFPGENGRLFAENRQLLLPGTGIEDDAAAIVQALLAGPSESGLMTGLVAPLPANVTLGRTYAMVPESTSDGERVEQDLTDVTMLIDLSEPENGPPPPSGSLGEMLTVYSIVNTVVFNVEAVERVILTWNGVQPQTFAGHLDTSRPLTANTSFLARRRAASNDGE